MKILTASPLPLSRDSWTRDITVLYRGFAALGHDAANVRLHSLDGSTFSGVLQISRKEIESAAWWKNQACDLVVANTWGQPKNNAMVRAIKASGAKVVARLDSDGYNSPWNGLLRFFRITRFKFSETKPISTATIQAAIKTLLFSIPQVYDSKMLEHLSLADIIGIESEGARSKFTNLLRLYRRPDLINKLRVVRHPVVPEIDDLTIPPLTHRKNCIVCVGRWESSQKDAPLLIKTLVSALASRTDWEAHIFGSGEDKINALLQSASAAIAKRITLHGPHPHNEILEAYRHSKISLFTSRYESGPIAAQEALCLGCTVVGPPDIPSMQDLCSPELAGTITQSRNVADMSAGLVNQMQKYDSEIRAPVDIAQSAKEMFHVTSVCRNVLKAFHEG